MTVLFLVRCVVDGQTLIGFRPLPSLPCTKRRSPKCQPGSRSFPTIERYDSSISSAYSEKLLVLSGPAGAGKSTTVLSLANEFDYQVVEWINPVDTNKLGSPTEGLPEAQCPS